MTQNCLLYAVLLVKLCIEKLFKAIDDYKILDEKDRFHFLQTNIEANAYKPIIKVQEFDLDNLPSDEEFLSYFVEEDDE